LPSDTLARFFLAEDCPGVFACVGLAAVDIIKMILLLQLLLLVKLPLITIIWE